jgi:hypothetical protein
MRGCDLRRPRTVISFRCSSSWGSPAVRHTSFTEFALARSNNVARFSALRTVRTTIGLARPRTVISFRCTLSWGSPAVRHTSSEITTSHSSSLDISWRRAATFTASPKAVNAMFSP